MGDQKQAIILVVDEEPQILQLVRVILSRDGWRVQCARNIRQALRLCRRYSGRIALALVDAMTAESHGADWMDGLRAEVGNLRVIVMSAMAVEQPDASLGLLAKPFTPDLLRQTVRRALGRNALAAGRQ